jgi:hypothetical protein
MYIRVLAKKFRGPVFSSAVPALESVFPLAVGFFKG